jgi:hypothetical protein
MSDSDNEKNGTAMLVPQASATRIVDEVMTLLKQKRGENDLHQYLQGNPLAREALERELENQGIRAPVSVANKGAEAIVFTTSQNQLVRIAFALTQKTDHLPPTVLHPLKTIEINENPSLPIRVDIMPIVKTGVGAEISSSDIIQLIRDTASFNYLFYDAVGENIGRLSDGTPIIVDLGAVRANLLSQPPEELSKGSYIHYVSGGPQEMMTTLHQWAKESASHDYAASQRVHVESRGLKYGEISGVIPASRIQATAETLRPLGDDSGIANAMREGRHDEESWGKLMDEAQKIGGEQGGEAWREHIRDESKKRGNPDLKPK